ncbi:hypothetical protein BV898_05153 [Hypsibius exemplaris]|uniref:FAS1 domain-containing protein n=1 Tax=Hypsibius exemplaris TaxID=2072580 RepID=A0A1W0X017_HYPEX|nr:hypothetical protein BV898_05153 [Hypsibius exemplaris]
MANLMAACIVLLLLVVAFTLASPVFLQLANNDEPDSEVSRGFRTIFEPYAMASSIISPTKRAALSLTGPLVDSVESNGQDSGFDGTQVGLDLADRTKNVIFLTPESLKALLQSWQEEN